MTSSHKGRRSRRRPVSQRPWAATKTIMGDKSLSDDDVAPILEGDEDAGDAGM